MAGWMFGLDPSFLFESSGELHHRNVLSTSKSKMIIHRKIPSVSRSGNLTIIQQRDHHTAGATG